MSVGEAGWLPFAGTFRRRMKVELNEYFLSGINYIRRGPKKCVQKAIKIEYLTAPNELLEVDDGFCWFNGVCCFRLFLRI